MRETNTLLKTSRSLKSGQGASDLIKECVAETGGCRVSRSVRCARYARGSHAGCERRALRAERRQSRTDGTSGVTTRSSRQRARTRSSSTPKSRSGISSKTTSRVKYVLPRWLNNSPTKLRNCLQQRKKMHNGDIRVTYVC